MGKFEDSRSEVLETMETVSSGQTTTAKKKKKTLRERLLEYLTEGPIGAVGAPGGPRHRKKYKEALEETP